MKQPVVTICASCNFYARVVEIQEELEKQGLTVLVPKLATRMKETGDFEVSHYKTWFANPDDFPKKAELMRGHFEEVAKADAILVVNEEKKGIKNYIGGNVLMEMALAFFMNKPIFILNDYPEESPHLEEIKGLLPTLLHGKASDLPGLLTA